MAATLALDESIHRIRRRIRLLLAVRWCVLFSLGGTLAALLALLGCRTLSLPFPIPETALFLAGCAVVGAAVGSLRRVSPFQAALTTDVRLGLKDRLSSAVNLQPVAATDPMAAALLQDAARHAERIDVRVAYPLRAPRETRFLAGALGVLALALLLPNLPFFQSPRERAEREAMRNEGERIVRIAREMRKAPPPRNVEISRRVSQNLEQLGKQMRSGRLSKKQALVKLNKMTREVADAQKKMALGAAGKPLGKAGEELKKAAREAQAAKQPQESVQRLRDMADALSKNDMDKAAKLLKQMAERAASGKMSAAEMQQMAAEAQKMAQAMSDTQLQKAAQQLQKAAQQLRKGQTQQASRQMQQAGGT